MRIPTLGFALIIGLTLHAQQRITHQVDAATFAAAVKSDSLQILDVRSAQEFSSGHIANAMQADWNERQQFASRIAHLDSSKTVYVYCLVGARSAAAAQLLREKGFRKVIELEGGINAWKKHNLPLVIPAPVKQLTQEEYKSMISTDSLTLVSFGGSWCPPCRLMNPVIDSLRADPTLRFKYVEIDAALQSSLMEELELDVIPALIAYRNGEEIWRLTGIQSGAALRKRLR